MVATNTQYDAVLRNSGFDLGGLAGAVSQSAEQFERIAFESQKAQIDQLSAQLRSMGGKAEELANQLDGLTTAGYSAETAARLSQLMLLADHTLTSHTNSMRTLTTIAFGDTNYDKLMVEVEGRMAERDAQAEKNNRRLGELSSAYSIDTDSLDAKVKAAEVAYQQAEGTDKVAAEADLRIAEYERSEHVVRELKGANTRGISVANEDISEAEDIKNENKKAAEDAARDTQSVHEQELINDGVDPVVAAESSQIALDSRLTRINTASEQSNALIAADMSMSDMNVANVSGDISFSRESAGIKGAAFTVEDASEAPTRANIDAYVKEDSTAASLFA